MRSAVVICALAVVALSGCHRHEYHIGAGAPNAPEVYDQWHDHWLFGIINTEDPVNIQAICPSGNATVVDKVSFLNGLVGVLIGIVWSPTTVTIRCDRGTAETTLPVGDQTAARIAKHPRFLDWVENTQPGLMNEAIEAQMAARELLRGR